jgi:hypothetical protein
MAESCSPEVAGDAIGIAVRRTIKVFPGLTLNLSKSGVSASVGVRGARVTVGKTGIRKTVGIPGTGLSYTDYQRHGETFGAGSRPGDTDPHAIPFGVIVAVAFVLLLLFLAR